MQHDSAQIHWGASSCCLCISVSHSALLLSLRSAQRTSVDFSVCRATTVHQYKTFLLFVFSPKLTFFQSCRISLKMDLFYVELYSKCWYFCMKVAINFCLNNSVSIYLSCTLRTRVSMPSSLLPSVYLNQSFLSAFFQVWSWFDRFQTDIVLCRSK